MKQEEMLAAAFDYIDRNETAMIGMWRHLVTMESPSADTGAVARIASHLDTYCDAAGITGKIENFPGSGPAFTAWTEPGRLKPIAFLGHMDTVHPVGTFGEEPFRIEGDTVTGPGVFDMKGGDVIAVFALRALLSAGYRDRQIKLILTGDEEVAHALSDGEQGHLAEAFTDDCAAVFNCESGQPGEEVTIRRKGGAVFRITVRGKAAHAGKEPEKGASAIRQAAEMICRIERQSDPAAVTYNCGRIAGGRGANIIPDECTFSVGLRYITNQQYQEAAEMLQDLCNAPVVAGTSCSMVQNGFYPAMEPVPKTQALLDVYRNACRLLGRPEPRGVFQGGCSDSAFVSRQGIPVLCSLGVQGGGAHSRDEYAVLSSLTMQCKKLAAAVLLLPEDF